jgi:hypothetical protein
MLRGVPSWYGIESHTPFWQKADGAAPVEVAHVADVPARYPKFFPLSILLNIISILFLFQSSPSQQ